MRQLKKLLGVSTLQNTDIIIPEVLHSRLIELQDSKMVLRTLPGFWTDSELVGNSGDTKTYQMGIKPGGTGAVIASEVAPGGEIPESEEGIGSEITLKVRKIGVRPSITTEMIEDGKYDMMARNIVKATTAMARRVDEACGRGMTQESGAFPSSGLNSYNLITRSIAVASGFSFPDDVLTMMNALETNDGRPTDIIMHPNFYPGIRAAEWFSPVMNRPEQGPTSPLTAPNGYVGAGYGLRWWQSPSLAYSGTKIKGSGVVIMWDADQLPFVFLDKRALTVDNVKDPVRDLASAVFTQRFNVMNVVPSSVVWITGIYQTYWRDVTSGRAF